MKKIILILTIFLSLQAFSQDKNNLSNLDLTGKFAVYQDTVFSTEGTFYFKGIVKACKEIQNSNLKRIEKDLLFLHLINWWLYDADEPKPKFTHTTSTQKFVTNSNWYTKITNASMTITYKIPKKIISKNISKKEFDKASTIIEIPNSIKDEFYFYSDKYNATWWVFISHADWGLLKSKVELQKSITEGRERLIKAAKGYIATGGNPADLVDWEKASKKYNITPDDLK